MQFDPYYYPYPSRRNVIFGKNMVATSQPLAAEAGLQILRKGGNAIDAAIATAACLTVVEPTSNGIGGDAFAQVWVNGKLHGLNASGPAPALLNLEAVHKAGHKTMPERGLLPITVPGAPSAWAALSERFGNLSLKECLAPAIAYAEHGFPIAPITAQLWQNAYELYADYYKKTNDASIKHWFSTFASKGCALGGYAPKVGSIWRLPEQASTLADIAETNAKSFYAGSLAKKIDEFMQKMGGFLRADDLQDYKPAWVEPICTEYRGYNVWEIPPNGQGIISLMGLNIMRNFDLSTADNPDTIHKVIEATKLAFVDGLLHIADPKHMQVSVEDLLSADFGAMRAASIEKEALEPLPLTPPKGGTVYLATADAEGNMVSYIQSNYTGFGSGVVVPDTGIALQNRGACFKTDPSHVNCVAPKKLPYHTIIPGFITEANSKKSGNSPTSTGPFGPFGPFGMMGGFIQPQGHIMLMHNIIDRHLNPQSALDAPRFRWTNGRTVQVEANFPEALANALKRKGHDIHYGKIDDTDFGRGQIIWQYRDEQGIAHMGGTEPRTDGQIATY